MRIDIRKEEMRSAALFNRAVLFTPHRIAQEDIPPGWNCYDLRGTRQHPDTASYLEDESVSYRIGSVLSPVPLKKLSTVSRRIGGSFLLFGEIRTLRQFCRGEGLQYPFSAPSLTLRPASPDEAGLFYALPPEKDAELGAVGHVRIDFGREGDEFWHTWWPRGPEELNTPDFKEELGQVVDGLRESVLKNLSSMRQYCQKHQDGAIRGGTCCQNYGFVLETDHYIYRLRCNPIRGDYQAYLTCFDKQAQKHEMGLTKQGRQALRDAADPAKPHNYCWYVIQNINIPDQRVDQELPLEEAVQLYAVLDCADKRLGVTKDDISAVDLVISMDGREWLPKDWQELDSFKDDPVVAKAVDQIRQALEEQTQEQGLTMGGLG